MLKETQEKYLMDLKAWLSETKDEELEEMTAFFSSRLEGYETHMKSIWGEDYRLFSEKLPKECRHILDLGCGTGLELDEIWRRNPSLSVTGVDLCQDMLNRLLEKHADKLFTAVCMDYFQYNFEKNKWDAVISFESLHHFEREKKKQLYGKICDSLKDGGVFLLGDYTACCIEEEELLYGVYLEKRKRCHTEEGHFVHFDIPLTEEHEMELLKAAGFSSVELSDELAEAVLFIARK